MELSKRIGVYRPPKKYREVRSSDTRQEIMPRKGNSSGMTKPGTAFSGTVDLYGED
jgi:hypothetical protein